MFSPNGAPEPKRTLGAQWCYKRAREYACGDFFFEKIQTRIVYSSSSLSSSKFAAAYICFVNTGLVDRLDRPPGMMLDASTSSPDKSSMTSEFSESESTVFFFFCFLSFFCFFFGRSSSSSVLSASSCSSRSPRRSKVSLKVVGFSIIARLDTKMH